METREGIKGDSVERITEFSSGRNFFFLKIHASIHPSIYPSGTKNLPYLEHHTQLLSVAVSPQATI